MRLIDADALKTRAIIWNGKPETVVDLREIQNAPTIDAAPVVHGRWVCEPDRIRHWYCSECGRVEGVTYEWMKYCPNCGAKMDGGEDNG